MRGMRTTKTSNERWAGLAVVVALALMVLGGCASAPAPAGVAGEREPAGGAQILVRNDSRDAWDLFVGGAPRGSVGPGSVARLLGIRPGPQVVVASNERLGLTQRVTVEADARAPAEVALRQMVARLRVKNPHADAVEVALDGVVLGRVAGGEEALFEGAPAGRRVLMIRSMRGPGAVRIDKDLPPEAEARVTVPDIEVAAVDPGAAAPPAGKAMVRMKNASRLAVSLWADGVDHGIVPAGASFDLVLPPGAHTLEVRIAGIEAHTEHRVTLAPNQVAEWVWGAEGGQP